jgi:hypothetical protein
VEKVNDEFLIGITGQTMDVADLLAQVINIQIEGGMV